MLSVTVYRNPEGTVQGIQFSGHAEYREAGEDIVCAARLMNDCHTDSVKLHSLHIPYHTELYRMYCNHEFEIIPKEAYFKRLYLFLKELKPTIAVQRLFSRAPKEDTAFCNWQTSWWKLEEEFFRYAEEQGGLS